MVAKRRKPPPTVPSNTLPLVEEETRIATEAWYNFFTNLTAPSTPYELVDFGEPPPNPFRYTAVHAGNALVIGGTVSSVGIARGPARKRITIANTGQTRGFFPLSQGDQLIITYTALPVLWYIPNGNPS